MRGWLLCAVLGAALARASVTHAAEPGAAAAPPKAEPPELEPRTFPTTREFYGWQILASGEVGGLLSAAALVLPNSPTNTPLATFAFLFGVPTYVLGGPIVHWSHGEFEKGLVSAGANLVVPALAGLVGSSVRCSQTHHAARCSSHGFFGGMAIAMVTIPVADALLLGWESVQVEPTGRRAAPRWALAPTWQVGAGAMEFGVAGKF